ncbi:MAG: protein kinase, partial [Acidimicrobiia bacterium]|nr:protein kinase [Acidimicrobiia bacterium]
MNTPVETGSILAARYRIEGKLGEGAAGTVLLAHDLKHDCPVAVKVLSSDASRRGIRRFQDEIRMGARLNHPNILTIFDSGEVDGSLYYVMPWVRGESLRERLRREGHLTVEEAVRIASAVARGLAHAHAEGVVHRDIKPENLLLDSSGNVYIADFGVAHALSDPHITTRGVAPGTTLYMSPEQAETEVEVDGRSDLYALGCVLFEMLTGEAPFPGNSAPAILRRHLLEPPPSVRSRRADVPSHLDDAIRRVLAKHPDERFTTGESFARSLVVEGPSRTRRSRTWPTPYRMAVGVGAMALAALGIARFDEVRRIMGLGPPLDPMTLAVFPLRNVGVSSAPQGVENGFGDPSSLLETALYDAFAWWDEITVTDRMAISDELTAAARTGGLSVRQADAMAEEHEAGRFVLASLSPRGDSIRLDAVLYATAGELLGQATRTFPVGVPPPDSLVRSLADELLNGSRSVGDGAVGPAGTRSLAARRAYSLGLQALEEWDLVEADRQLRLATELDDHFALALLRLAQSRNWAEAEVPEWLSLVAHALRDGVGLTERDRRLADALRLLGEGAYPESCTLYRRLADADPNSFAAWYGIGECTRRDNLVVADSTGSPTGWRFRASFQESVEAYRRAFTSIPSSYRALSPRGFERLSVILRARGDMVHLGQTEGPDPLQFLGWPVLRGDTLVMTPYRADRPSQPPL